METTEKDTGSAQSKDEILNAVRERISATKIVDVNEQTVQLVFFTLLGGSYAIKGEDVKEILYPGKITPVPGTPAYLLGLINVRGDVESVVDFNLFLSLQKEPESANKRILIAEKAGLRTGILVGSVMDVEDVPKSTVGASIGTIDDSKKEFIAGSVSYRDKNVTLLDLEKVFQKMEKL
ncbi:MAG: chemotaxis protein CheW [Nitrospinae bacterium]|nr:chemotaxis protein CheW [Nitrospinota bacterium]